MTAKTTVHKAVRAQMEITRPLPERQSHDIHFGGQKSQIEVEDSQKWNKLEL